MKSLYLLLIIVCILVALILMPQNYLKMLSPLQPLPLTALKSVSRQDTTKRIDTIWHQVVTGVRHPADLGELIIGTDSTHPVDEPYDNLCHIYLPAAPKPDEVVRLNYKLLGVSNHTGVARSINDAQAIGGPFVQFSDAWSQQSELISPSLLHQGDNVIRFGSPLQAHYRYRVADLSLVVEKRRYTEPEIVINQPQPLCYGDTAYVKGLLCLPAKENREGSLKLLCNGQPVALYNDEFEITAPKSASQTLFQAKLQAILPSGKTITKTITFADAKSSFAHFQFAQKGVRNEALKAADKDVNVGLSSHSMLAGVHIPSNALKTDKVISVLALRKPDFAPLNGDLVNVTKGAQAFRFLPHGSRFDTAAQISLSYDTALIPKGSTPDDIHTYYFDERIRQWVELQRDSIDRVAGIVKSETRHFTDMINAIIKMPESPERQPITPTSLKDFKAADPSAGITSMSPPSANSGGNAALEFALKLPAGRLGMQPSLGLHYNNEGGNGWTGLGWDLSVPSITIDTRWGVPRYDAGKETETYTLSGEQLAPTANGVFVPRTAEKIFEARQEGGFSKIVRHGNSPKNYWWEVINKNGTRSFFGGTPRNGVVAGAVLTTPQGNIAHWVLVETRDTHDNFVSYEYRTVQDEGNAGSVVPGYQIYLQTIYYTGHGTQAGPYKVYFQRDRQLAEARRIDVDINCRLGTKVVTADLLRKISVSYYNQPIRSYELVYQQGAFNKTLLKSVSEFDNVVAWFYTDSFSYYNDVNAGNIFVPLNSPQSWFVDNDNVKGSIYNPLPGFSGIATMLASAVSRSITGGVVGTIGVWNFKRDKSATIGGGVHFTKGETEGLETFVDINGDHLPDKVFKKNGLLWYRPNLFPQTGFGSIRPIVGITNFNYTQSFSTAKEVEVNILFASYAREKTNTTTTTTTYFADFNSDGLIDVAVNGHVYFNRLVNGDPVFIASSINTPNPIVIGSAVSPQFYLPDTAEQAQLERDFPLHDVIRMWQAPFSGNINITAPVQLINLNTANPKADGVRASIQLSGNVLWSTTISANDFSVKSPLLDSIPVQKGQRLYFRLQSIYNGDNDVVKWNPSIDYVNTLSPVADANGRATKHYEALKDFVLAGSDSVGLYKDGAIKIDGTFTKAVTSDTVELVVTHTRNSVSTTVFQQSFAPHTVVSPQALPVITQSVNDSDRLQFAVRAGSYIDLAAVQWKPHYQYTSFTDTTPVTDINGNPTIDEYVTPYLANYNDWLIKTPAFSNVSKDTITIKPVLAGSSAANGMVSLTVKGTDTVYCKRSISIANGIAPNISPIQVVRKANDVLYCEYHVADSALARDLAAHTAKLVFHKDTLYADTSGNVITAINDTLQAGLFTNPVHDYLGSFFRGWAQFSFKGDTANQPLDETKINAAAALAFPRNPNSYADTALLDSINPVSEMEFIMLTANAKQNRWQGLDSSVYITGDTMSSSRYLLHDVKLDPILNTAGGPVNAAAMVNKETNVSTSGGISYGVDISVCYAKNTSKSVVMVYDVNADGYPDVVSKDGIQYSNPDGSLGSFIANHPGENVSAAVAKTVSTGGQLPQGKTKTKPSTEGENRSINTSKQFALPLSLSGSSNASYNNNEIQVAMIDVNGDGLPDRVYNTGRVSLNMGYGFAAPDWWNTGDIEKGTSYQTSPGIRLGYTKGFASFQGGISLSRSNGSTSKALVDMNGDDLPDKVWLNASTLMVELGTGSGFDAAKPWNGFLLIGKNESVGEAANAAYTHTWVISFGFWALKVCVNPSFSVSHGVSRETDQIIDVNGDGYPDLVHSDNDGNLTVSLSTIGRTNMLKTVQNPLGSSFTIDYERMGNTYNMPQSKWVLKNVEVYDGLRGDGVDTMRSTFSYSGGYHDRREREFYGFKTVTSQQLYTAAGNAVYRSHVQNFHNGDYYTKGLPESEWLQDAAGNKYTQTNNTYELRSVADSVKFPALVQTEKLFYEGKPTPGASTKTAFDYDAYGNVTKIIDAGDGSQQDLVTALVEYHHNTVNYIHSIPSKLEVYTAEGLKRKRTTLIDNLGNIIRISQFLTNDSVAETDMAYDIYGNLTKLTRPKNYRGQRMWFSYGYDTAVQTYNTKITDAFGYVSTSTYDVVFGNLISTVSINNEQMRYKYDNRGRLTAVTGPYEIAAGKPYTIAFEYYPNAITPYAVTRHYDPEWNADIKTITFVDGLGRTVQVKKQTSIFKGKNIPDELKYVVSERMQYDALGRDVKSFYRTTEALGANNLLSNALGSLASSTTYDVLDRKTKVVLADGATTTMAYSVDTGRFSTLATDALGNKKVTLTDVRERTRATKVYGGPNGTIVTTFQYNALSELMRVVDAGGNATENTYDNLGRTTSVKHPDAGLTEFHFDLAGNLLGKTTAQIRKEIPNGGMITYGYDYERLTDINYPRQYQNKVKYTYGAAGTGSKAGRLILQEDASGGQEFFYGRLGEIIKTIRTVLISRVKALTYVTEQKYDTWNRLKEMTYPDGEVVKYHYNRGGGLLSVDGYKLGNNYTYVAQLGADEYGQRVYLRYGNGTETYYQYDSVRRRMTNMQATTASGRKFFNNTYRYDAVSNILGITNNVQAVAGKLGGYAQQEYHYDNLYRLDSASGRYRGYNDSASYNMKLQYDNLYNIVYKKMDDPKPGRSYEQLYKYTGAAPHQATQIGNNVYRYDFNGNNLGTGDIENFWDEENRMMAVINSGVLSLYTYDASGERVIKSSGPVQGMWVNGAPAGFTRHYDNFIAYVSPYLVCREHSFTKHYYIEGQRIATKLGYGEFKNNNLPLPVLTAGGINYPRRAQELENQWVQHITAHPLSPGPPTDKLFWARPENSGIQPPVLMDTTHADVPMGWPAPPSNPGYPIHPPVVPTNDSVHAGFGFDGTGHMYEKDQYFYHPDHLGSTGYVTDAMGEVNQHMEYSAYGETLFEEHNSSFESPYLFNAKEKDVETGYYYYGARLYDPKTSLWLSVDPMAGKYPGLSPYNYCFDNPLIYKDPDGRDGVRIIDTRAHTITIKAVYFIQTQPWEYTEKGHTTRIEGYTPGDIASFQQINTDLNNLGFHVTEGEYEGYTVHFDLEFRDGGTLENAGTLAGNELYEHNRIGNTITKTNSSVYSEFKEHINRRADKSIIYNADGTPQRVVEGGHSDHSNITMNSEGNHDTRRNRKHEIFHTFDFHHPEGIGGSRGIMRYFSDDDVDQQDINELANKAFLPAVIVKHEEE